MASVRTVASRRPDARGGYCRGGGRRRKPLCQRLTLRFAARAQVIGPDKHGIKTVIEYKIKEDGTKARGCCACFPISLHGV